MKCHNCQSVGLACVQRLATDEMWFFVGSKREKYGIWLALDEKTREIVGVYVGDRSAVSAKPL